MDGGSRHCTGGSDQDNSQKKKKCNKAKWLSEQILQTAEKRRQAKGKGEKDRCTHLNAEFRRIAKRDKKAILRDLCKETEENNRMGKTRDIVKKIRDTKGNFHAKMDTIKDRNGMDLTEAEDIKKCQGYTEELYKRDLNDPDNHNDVITHLEPDILECKAKGALGSITVNKASGDDGIPAELFKTLKVDAVNGCTQYVLKIGKLSSDHTTGKGQFSFQSQRREMPKNVQTTIQLYSFHMLAM